MSSAVRFWGTVLSVKPRLVLTKWEGETTARGDGVLALIEGMSTEDDSRPELGRFMVAFGPATVVRHGLAVGDLLRGDAHRVPDSAHDTPADLYRVGVLRTIARAGDPGTSAPREPDPPLTDPPLTPEKAEIAPRRPLRPANLDAAGPCCLCGYGVVVPVVRLSDPRQYRNGRWSHVPACLGPQDCPHYAAP
jgi:hypothetical protein